MISTKQKFIIYSALVYFVCLPQYAHAYLDPGTGSYLFQILIAGALGGMFFLKNIVKRIKNIFKNTSGKHRDEDYE